MSSVSAIAVILTVFPRFFSPTRPWALFEFWKTEGNNFRTSSKTGLTLCTCGSDFYLLLSHHMDNREPFNSTLQGFISNLSRGSDITIFKFKDIKVPKWCFPSIYYTEVIHRSCLTEPCMIIKVCDMQSCVCVCCVVLFQVNTVHAVREILSWEKHSWWSLLDGRDLDLFVKSEKSAPNAVQNFRKKELVHLNMTIIYTQFLKEM